MTSYPSLIPEQPLTRLDNLQYRLDFTTDTFAIVPLVYRTSPTSILHINPPHQASTSGLHINPPHQASTSILHIRPPHQSSTSGLHINPPHQSSTLILHVVASTLALHVCLELATWRFAGIYETICLQVIVAISDCCCPPPVHSLSQDLCIFYSTFAFVSISASSCSTSTDPNPFQLVPSNLSSTPSISCWAPVPSLLLHLPRIHPPDTGLRMSRPSSRRTAGVARPVSCGAVEQS